MNDTIEKYIKMGYLTLDSKMQILNEMGQSNYALSERIYDAENVLRNSHAFLNASSFELAYDLAKSGQVRQYKTWYKMNMPEFGKNLDNIPRLEDITGNFSFESFIVKEDYDNGKQWDNKKFVSKVKSKLFKELTTKSLVSKQDSDKTETVSVIRTSMEKIKNFFYKITNKQKALPPGNSYTSSRTNLKVGSKNPEYKERENTLTQYRIEGKALYDPTLRNSRGVMKEEYRKNIKRDSDGR